MCDEGGIRRISTHPDTYRWDGTGYRHNKLNNNRRSRIHYSIQFQRRVYAEIFHYEKIKNSAKIKMVHQKTHAVYTEYEIIRIRMLRNHLLREIKALAEINYPGVQIELKGLPDMDLFGTEKTQRQDENREKENIIQSMDGAVARYSIDILDLLNKGFVNISSLVCEAEKTADGLDRCERDTR